MNPDINERQTEERIETVLAGLREAQPAPGMEQRISAALQQRAGVPAGPRWTWLRMPQIAVGASVVAAALLVSALVYRQAASPTGRSHKALRLPGESGRVEKAAGFSPLHPALADKGLQPRPSFTGAEALSPRQRVSGLKAAAPSGDAAQARATLQARAERGFPAPPLQLTEQERLLVRLVHRDDPVQLAQLAPAAREANLQREREQVHEFFKAPPMLAANFTLEPYPTLGGTQ